MTRPADNGTSPSDQRSPEQTNAGVRVPAPKFNFATLAEQVYEHLRQGILANQYPPGTPLPEEALANSLRVSRVPVREALRRLAADGLVTVVPRQGSVVSSLSPRQFLDAYQVREALEVLAVRLAVAHLGPQDLAELDQLQAAMAEAAARDDVDAFFSANFAFHAVFIDRSGNENLKEMYYPLVTQMQRYYVPSLYLRGGMERSIGEHWAIIEAVKAGDAEAAARLLSEHIRVPQVMLESGDELDLAPVGAQRSPSHS